MLEDRVDVPPVRRDAGDRLAGEVDLALGGLLEAGDHPQRRRLAAAGRAEERVERARARSPGRIRSTATTSPKRLVTSTISTSGAPSPSASAEARRPRAGGATARCRGAVNGGPRAVDPGADRRRLKRCYRLADGTGARSRSVNAIDVRISDLPVASRPAVATRLKLYFRSPDDRDVDRTRPGDDRAPARCRGSGRCARRAAHAARGRRAGRRDRELPLAGRARGRRARRSRRSSGSPAPSTWRSPSCSPRSPRPGGSSGARRAGGSPTRASRAVDEFLTSGHGRTAAGDPVDDRAGRRDRRRAVRPRLGRGGRRRPRPACSDAVGRRRAPRAARRAIAITYPSRLTHPQPRTAATPPVVVLFCVDARRASEGAPDPR